MKPNREKFYQRLLNYKATHPDANNASLGRLFKITRERVRQIIRDHGQAKSAE